MQVCSRPWQYSNSVSGGSGGCGHDHSWRGTWSGGRGGGGGSDAYQAYQWSPQMPVRPKATRHNCGKRDGFRVKVPKRVGRRRWRRSAPLTHSFIARTFKKSTDHGMKAAPVGERRKGEKRWSQRPQMHWVGLSFLASEKNNTSNLALQVRAGSGQALPFPPAPLSSTRPRSRCWPCPKPS